MTVATQPWGLGITDVVHGDLEAMAERLGPRLDALSGAHVVVAGGGGFLLSYLVDLLALVNERGDSRIALTVLDNFSSGSPARLHHLEGRSGVSIRHVDVAQPIVMDQLADFVVHGASIASPPLYRRFPVETIEANVWGTRHLLDYALQSNARSFVFISSSEIYGDPVQSAIPTPETYQGNVSSTGPRACYDESKRLGETLCLAYHRQHGVPAKLVRPFNVYGPRLSLEDGRIVPDLVKDALSDHPLKLFSDGSATRSFCYVADAVVGIAQVMLSAHDGEAFNIGNDDERTIRSIAELVAELAPTPKTIEYETHGDPEYLTDNPNRRCPDLTKSRQLLDFEPTVGIDEGIDRTLRHYLLSTPGGLS